MATCLGRSAWLYGLMLLGLGTAAAGQTSSQDAAPKKRTFLGSIQVPPDRREQILRFLHDKGFTGVYIPADAAPETLLYRGTMDGHHEALLAVWKLLEDPEQSMMKKIKVQDKPLLRPKPRLAEDGKSDEDYFGKVDLSPLQKELLAAFHKEMAKRSEEFRDGSPVDDAKIKRGEEFNKWMHENFQAILTQEQYNGWLRYWGAQPRQAKEGKPPFTVPDGKERSDEAIFNRLALSPKQVEHLRKHLDWLRQASQELKESNSNKEEEGKKLNAKWRAGLDHILTKEQRQKYQAYWGQGPG
jgi:hypothetical protein